MQEYDVHKAIQAPPIPWDGQTPFERWRRDQGLPVHVGFHMPDIRNLETAPWALVGAEAAFIELQGTEETNAAYLLRLDAHDPTFVLSHPYEQVIYVMEGEGSTTIEVDGETATCNWAAGSLFAIPIGWKYRHTARAGSVMYCVTSAPLVMNLFHNGEFDKIDPSVLAGAYPLRPDFFDGRGTIYSRKGRSSVWETNFVRDCRTIPLPPANGRGGDGRILNLQLGCNSLISHVSEFASGAYKKAHRHGPGAHVIILGGDGYSFLWKEQLEDRIRVDWTGDVLFVPPSMWWHQHFNAHPVPSRYLAIRWGSSKFRLDHSYDGAATDRRLNGNQIEYDDEAALVFELFEEECRRHGVDLNPRFREKVTSVAKDPNRRNDAER